LDEPLGALDAKLRKALQIELKALQERVGITFVYVTHDQEEALTMSDRIAVMSEGRVEQVGPPKAVYEEPRTVYVADFLGVSNLMEAEAKVRADAGGCHLRLGEFELRAAKGNVEARGEVKVVVRPERVIVEDRSAAGENTLPGMVERVVYVGPVIQLLVRLAEGTSLQSMVPNRGQDIPFEQGSAVNVTLPADALRVLEDTGARVTEEDLEAGRGPTKATPAPAQTKAS
jgi:spermidine/putrescine transport system ATP-binding protein